MRSLKLLGIVAAAAALVAAAGPAGASASARTAVRHPSPNGRCAVNINVAPGHLINAGESVFVWGRLRCHGRGSNVASQTVTLLQRTSSSGGFGGAQTALTDSHGFYEFTVTGVENNSSFFVRSHGAASGRRTVSVEAAVTLNGPPEGTQLFTGPANKVTFTGTVNPADVGARVVLQRQNAVTGNEWRRIDAGPRGSRRDLSRSRTGSSSPGTPTSACSFAAAGATSRAPRTCSPMRSHRHRTRT